MVLAQTSEGLLRDTPPNVTWGPKRRKRMSAPMSAMGVLSGLVLLTMSFVGRDPLQSAPGSWQRIGGGSPPRGRFSQPPRPRVMHEVLFARAAVKRSQGRPRAKY